MRAMGCLVALLMLTLLPSRALAETDLATLLQRSLAAYARVDDYRCTFHKRELVRGVMVEVRNMDFKFRKPASFYLKYTEGENAGLEAIYVEGKYDNRMEVHLGGFFGFFHLAVDPHGSLALHNNRHAIMEAGIGQILKLMESNYQLAQADPLARIAFGEEVLLSGGKADLVEARFPAGKGYYGSRVLLYIDRQTALPVKITVYGAQDELLEDYQYEGIILNADLTERDFDIENPEYRF